MIAQVVWVKFWTPAEEAYLRRWHGRKAAAVIAGHLGRTRTQVYEKIGRMGLGTCRPQFGDGDKRRLVELARKGLCNRCIGRAISHERHCVARWRKKLDASPLTSRGAQGQCPQCLDRVRRDTRRQCRAAGLPSLAEVRATAFRDYARRAGWPEDLRPRAVQILDFLYKSGPATREAIAAAIGMPWKGSRKSLVSNDPEGSYLAHLARRGLVQRLGRIVKGKGSGHSTYLYAVPLEVRPAIARGVRA